MIDPLIHLLLFAAIGSGIVALAAFYSEPEDRQALPALPRRFMVFAFGCGVLALLVVIAEHTVASVS